ncbi:MAG TPA: hypothetical protein VFR34_09895 [Paracoccaceae bacterium]|nr:hypothetical protein [Paracoccaceae bacterium]
MGAIGAEAAEAAEPIGEEEAARGGRDAADIGLAGDGSHLARGEVEDEDAAAFGRGDGDEAARRVEGDAAGIALHGALDGIGRGEAEGARAGLEVRHERGECVGGALPLHGGGDEAVGAHRQMADGILAERVGRTHSSARAPLARSMRARQGRMVSRLSLARPEPGWVRMPPLATISARPPGVTSMSRGPMPPEGTSPIRASAALAPKMPRRPSPVS